MSAQQYLPAVLAAGQKYGVRPSLLASQLQQESGFNPSARSPAGALGIAQFMPGTAKGFGIDPMNPSQAIDAQAKYMSQLLHQYHGNEQLALAAYNAGSGNVAKYGGVPPFAETHNYIKNILAGESRFPRLAKGLAPAGAKTANVAASVSQPSSFNSSTNPSASQGNDPSQARSALLAYLMTSSATNANGQAGGDPNAGLVSLLSSMPQQQAPSASGIQIQASTPQAATKAAKNPNVGTFVKTAEQFLGTPYSWGGGGVNGPSKGFAQGANTVGFDCSSFVQYVWNKSAGVTIPRTTYDQWKAGKAVSKNALSPGDAVYFNMTSRGPEHVGMYIGNGQFIEAPHTGATIRISNLKGRSDFVGARRFA